MPASVTDLEDVDKRKGSRINLFNLDRSIAAPNRERNSHTKRDLLLFASGLTIQPLHDYCDYLKRDPDSRDGDPMNPAEKIDELIEGIVDWRGKTFAAIRKSILGADKEIIEEWKWMGSPVWSRDGMIAVANAHKGKVKLTFAHGANIPDPHGLFNAGLEGNERRAIDFFEGDKVNDRALKDLVRSAIEFNLGNLKKNVKKVAPAGTRAKVEKARKA
jgi:hypothetical protein